MLVYRFERTGKRTDKSIVGVKTYISAEYIRTKYKVFFERTVVYFTHEHFDSKNQCQN